MWNARKCVPAILATDGSSLRLTSADEVAFHAPGPQIRASFGKLQTLTLTVDGVKYAIVGKPANLSPSFTQAQMAELAEATRLVSAAGTSHTWMAAASPLAGGVGAIFDMRQMAKNIAPWKKILPAIGVQVS